jgi:hypothetical protein
MHLIDLERELFEITMTREERRAKKPKYILNSENPISRRNAFGANSLNAAN